MNEGLGRVRAACWGLVLCAAATTLGCGGGGSAETPPDRSGVAGKVCTAGDGSGWCWQRPLPQGNFITAYWYADDTRGWAVGTKGTLLATRDGGSTWIGQQSGTILDLTHVVFADAQVGWAAASQGSQLLRTVDGGSTWTSVTYGLPDGIRSLGVADAQTAWLTSNPGIAYITRDGGASWSPVNPPDGSAASLVVVSQDGRDAWALPVIDFGNATLQKSSDDGASWNPVVLPALESGMTRSDFTLQFGDRLDALLTATEQGFSSATQTFVFRQALWRTPDGGATWIPVAVPDPGSLFQYQFQLTGASIVYAGASVASQPLVRTADDGASWAPVATPAGFSGPFAAFTPRRLLVRNGSGRTVLTTDGGDHWSASDAYGTTEGSIGGLWFFDAHEGIAFLDDGSRERTTDGGRTWKQTAPPDFASVLRRPQFLADWSLGWALRSDGVVVQSRDRGATWVAPLLPAAMPASAFHFVDAQNGFAVSSFGPGEATIRATGDGGSTWRGIAGTEDIVGLQAVAFGDAIHGVAVGPIGLALVTADGGATWDARPTGSQWALERVAFADARVAVAVGGFGTILRTTDAGQSWRVVPGPTPNTLRDVRFVSATVGHAAGDGGIVLLTTDAGATWQLLPTGTDMSFNSVAFVDARIGWVAGSGGTILATITGGR